MTTVWCGENIGFLLRRHSCWSLQQPTDGRARVYAWQAAVCSELCSKAGLQSSKVWTCDDNRSVTFYTGFRSSTISTINFARLQVSSWSCAGITKSDCVGVSTSRAGARLRFQDQRWSKSPKIEDLFRRSGLFYCRTEVLEQHFNIHTTCIHPDLIQVKTQKHYFERAGLCIKS